MEKLNPNQLIDHFHDSAFNRVCETCNQQEKCLKVYDLDHDETIWTCYDCAKTDFLFVHGMKYIMSDRGE